MNSIEKKIQALAAKNPKSNWKETVEYRKANKAWLRKSSEIALRILDALDDLGWSQTKLATKLDVTKQQVSKIVKGRENFTIESLVKIESVLGINLASVLQADELIVKKELHEGYKAKFNSQVSPIKNYPTAGYKKPNAQMSVYLEAA